MKKIIIFLFFTILSYTSIFIPSCFSDALYTLDGKGDIYLVDDQGRISGYKDGLMLEEIPGVSPYITDGGGSSEDWKQIYMSERKDLKTIIVGKSDGTYKLMIAGGNYHLDIEGVETKKGQVDEIISRENSTEINFDDDKKGYYNLDMDFRSYKNGSIYFYQQEATGKTQKYIVDWEGVDKGEENSTLYIVDNDYNSSQNLLINEKEFDNNKSSQNLLNNKKEFDNNKSSQKPLNNEKKFDNNKSISIYGRIIIFAVSLSIIGVLSYLYYKKKISKKLFLIIIAFLLLILVTFLILSVNNNEKLEQKELGVKTNSISNVNNNENLKQKELGEKASPILNVNNNEKLDQKESLIGTGNCLKPIEIGAEYDGQGEYDIVKEKVLMRKPADNNRGYEVITTEIDSGTFKIIGSGYTKDKYNIYYIGEKINGVDYCSFEISVFGKNSQNISGIARDKNNIYKAGKILQDADVETFIKEGTSYFKDKNNIYNIKGEIIIGSDADTLTYYKKGNFFYDKNGIYYHGINIKGADYETFQDTGVGFIFKDKNNIYFKSNKIDGVDIETFKEISNRYFKDKNHLYNSRGEIIKSIDVNSYYLILQTQVLFDKKGLYLSSGKYFPGADAKSFIGLGDSYYKDVHSIYYSKMQEKGEKYIIINIDNVDLASFSNIGRGYAKDKNRVYYEGKAVENSDPNICKNQKECSNNYPQK